MRLKTGSQELQNVLEAAQDKLPGSITFSVGAESANAIITTITVKDMNGDALAAMCPAKVWISDTAAAVPSGTAPNGAVSFTTGVLVKEQTTKVANDVITSATGQIVVSITESTAKSFYINVACGSVVASQVITFV